MSACAVIRRRELPDTPPGRAAKYWGGAARSWPAPGTFVRGWIAAGALAAAVALALAATEVRAAVTASGAVIRNVASVSWAAAGTARAMDSNPVTFVVEPAPTPAQLRLERYAPTAGSAATLGGPAQCRGAQGVVPLPAPIVQGSGPIDPREPLPLAAAEIVHGGDAVFLRVRDADQNRDARVTEYVEVSVSSASGDTEIVRLIETGPATGEFAGYVPTATAAGVSGDCVLQIARDGALDARYVDPRDALDAAHDAALVDPFGMVFDARTGQPIDGARVRLLEAVSGAPAAVFGDDGVSRYPAEVITGQPATDAGGTLYSLPSGVFRFPLVAPGSYRLEITPPPGFVFPSSAPPGSLQTLPGAPFDLHDGSWGRDFTVLAPPGMAVDVPLDPGGSGLFLRKSASTVLAAPGDLVQYSLEVENTSGIGRFPGVRIVDRLPQGVRYRSGSGRLGESARVEPTISADGRELTFDLGALGAGARARLRYVAEISLAARGKALVNSARATGTGAVQSNEATATIRLRRDLFTERGFIAGRVHEASCETGPEGRRGAADVRVYLEDGRYALTDEEGRYHFEDVAPGAHVVQLDTLTVPAHLEAAACDDDPRFAGRAYSQFVKLRAGALQRADFRLTPRTVPANADPGARPSGRAHDVPIQEISGSAAEEESGWLEPREGEVPPIAAIRIALRHGAHEKVDLMINGEPVSALNFDGAEAEPGGTTAVSRWRGVDLRDGENVLVAVLRAADGTERRRLERRVHYGAGAVRAAVFPEASRLVADGRTRPLIALRLVDAYGKPARPGTTGAWRVDPPHRSWWEVESLNDNQLLAIGPREPTFEIGDGGLALLELEPTSQSGHVVVHLRFNERQQQTLRVWLEPEAREWILVGIATGTAAWHTLSGNMDAAAAAGLSDGFEEDGRVAFFAKGRIKGEFLLTLAYDSARDPEVARERLLGVIEPDRYYLLYGDGTEPREEAASSRKLYLKLERRQFAALFGDFATGLTVTELARYSRTLNGVKTDFSGERIEASAFAARSDQGFVKDELRGDGTSGLYRLARAPLVIGSEQLRIEVRDRFRPERIVESRRLARFLDYSIDYQNGTIFFKEPVPSRDPDFHPVFIVAEYETLRGGADETVAGGRVAVGLARDALELGVSWLHEGAAAGDTQLGGLDARWELTGATRLHAEVAASRSADPARREEAAAWVAEIEHVTERLEGRAYLRTQEPGFGLGQQLSLDAGARRMGVDGRWRFASAWQIATEAFRQRMLEDGAERSLASAEIRRQSDTVTLGAGLRHVEDVQADSEELGSEQAFASGSIDLFERRVTLRASGELPLGGRDASGDYPGRALLGIDYRLSADTTLFADYEHTEGERLASNMTRIGVRARPWERTQIVSSVDRSFGEYGPRALANFGLTQGFRLDEHWAFDVGVDQSRTLRRPRLVPLSASVPLASGSLDEDFFAAFLGAQYREALWTFSSRAEHRNADSEDRWTLTSGLYREPVHGHALSIALQGLASDLAQGANSTAGDLRLAWAWRAIESRWMLLHRLDFKHDRREEGALEQESARVVANLHAHWRASRALETGVQLGARHVTSTFDGERYRGLSLLAGLDLRRNLGRRIDLGLHGAWLGSLESEVEEHAIGADVGLTIVRNAWIAIGYNFAGFRDGDFSAGRHTDRGPYLELRLKVDQDSFRDLRLDSLRPPR